MTSTPVVPGYSGDDTARLAEEPVKETVRSPFARDRARVLHSAGLRRLAAKTQVMVAGQDDFPRTRLTHTLEVAQIARELGGALGCDPDVVEVAGLAHDLGHPPFGHNGEEELNRLADSIGGFEGNAQTLRVLTRLEAKVHDDDRDRSVGLNLTRACLDASCKYPWPRGDGGVGLEGTFGSSADDADVYAWVRRGAPDRRTCLEEQVMDWSDDVAYSVHDVEDAVHVGLINVDLFADADASDEVVAIAREKYLPSASDDELAEAIARLTSLEYWPESFSGSHRDMVTLKRFTSYLIGRFGVTAPIATQMAYGDASLTRYAADLVVPDEVRAEVAVMKAITAAFVMRRPGADAEYSRQREMIAELVHALTLEEGRSLEPSMADAFARAETDSQRFRVIIDQVASLTDVSLVQWHKRLVR
ncbi:MAG: deoxyguanosinetriphosphate triphosphohydrolase [Actinomycetota bacterium]|nr:deoxyguanosinetriphosphate triphosphohydrolase [Actinomycetota bacterium]